jgi:hypothetical protein
VWETVPATNWGVIHGMTWGYHKDIICQYWYSDIIRMIWAQVPYNLMFWYNKDGKEYQKILYKNMRFNGTWLGIEIWRNTGILIILYRNLYWCNKTGNIT